MQLAFVVAVVSVPRFHVHCQSAAEGQLELRSDEAERWDFCRRKQWPEVDRHFAPPAAKAQSAFGFIDGQAADKAKAEAAKRSPAVELQWMSHVELSTHEPQANPLWMGPQFSYYTFVKGAADCEIVSR